MTSRGQQTASILGASLRVGVGAVVMLIVLAPTIVVAQVEQTQNYEILYNFTGGSDGGNPESGLIHDAGGNLYGTKVFGGDTACYSSGCGTVFELNAASQLTVLHAFKGGSTDGSIPYASLIRDPAGNLFGTTETGGPWGMGTVFQLDPMGNLTVLHGFQGPDGDFLQAELIRDTKGNLYGMAPAGGDYGYGAIFRVDAKTRKFKVLHSFSGQGGDGNEPLGGLVRDNVGNFYGTTSLGIYSSGSVFDFDISGVLTNLYSFNGAAEGSTPKTTLVRDPQGNLYGTTQFGGITGEPGTVFRLDGSGKLTTLYTFNGADGASPVASLLRDVAGTLYGTTYWGGAYGFGTVFALNPDTGIFRVLHNFAGGTDGAYLYSPLMFDEKGGLVGTTSMGGTYNMGTIFRIGGH